jgi:hypothetical protein
VGCQAGLVFAPRRLAHRNQAAPLTSGGDLNAKGNKRERRPSPVEQHSGKNDQATRDRTNRGTLRQARHPPGTALPMSYTPALVLTSGVEPESPGSQPSTLPLSYISMVPMG